MEEFHGMRLSLRVRGRRVRSRALSGIFRGREETARPSVPRARLRNPASSHRNAEEARLKALLQAARMNYNNFASRISAPRTVPISRPPVVPAPEVVRKPRKAARRRLSTAAALLFTLPFLIQSPRAQAADISGSFPNAAPAFISPQGLSDAGSFGKTGLSPVTEILLGIGVAVAAIQSRHLLGRGELEC